MGEKLRAIPPFVFVGILVLLIAVLYTFAPADRATTLGAVLNLTGGGFLALINPNREKPQETPSIWPKQPPPTPPPAPAPPSAP